MNYNNFMCNMSFKLGPTRRDLRQAAAAVCERVLERIEARNCPGK